jgi:hypothetical protein
LPPGIDVRGVGGCVVGPGAVLPDGTEWRFDPKSCTELPGLPLWLERAIRGEETQATNTNSIVKSSITTRERNYAEAALRAGIADVENAPKGRRNTVLNSVAYRLGRMIARGWIDRVIVEACLLDAASRLTKEDGFAAIRATIKSGIDAGFRKPIPDLAGRER